MLLLASSKFYDLIKYVMSPSVIIYEWRNYNSDEKGLIMRFFILYKL